MNQKMFRRKGCSHTGGEMSCWMCSWKVSSALLYSGGGMDVRGWGWTQNKLSCKIRSNLLSSYLKCVLVVWEKTEKRKIDETPGWRRICKTDKGKMSLWIVMGPWDAGKHVQQARCSMCVEDEVHSNGLWGAAIPWGLLSGKPNSKMC